jgi:N-acetylglucosaminyldiphosphoundecaprenol N-acetyl-beta-D-mannosaminyltransferase
MPASQDIETIRPVDVMGLPIRPFDLTGLIDAIVMRARAGVRTLGCYANAHTMNLAMSRPSYHDLLRSCDILYADGASVVLAARWLGERLPGRLTAMDYFPPLAARCASEGLSIFLLGSRPGIAAKAADAMRRHFPKLRIAGTHHGHFDAAQSEDVISVINAASPDILLVGMSSPRQEEWLARNATALQVPVRWCVGALFDYLAGVERRAPAFLCSIGCEWLYRLAMDPLGKWKRYLLGNPRFVWNVIVWRMGLLKRVGPKRSAATVKS